MLRTILAGLWWPVAWWLRGLRSCLGSLLFLVVTIGALFALGLLFGQAPA